jgi:hypothetical protein
VKQKKGYKTDIHSRATNISKLRGEEKLQLLCEAKKRSNNFVCFEIFVLFVSAYLCIMFCAFAQSVTRRASASEKCNDYYFILDRCDSSPNVAF